MVVCVLLLFKYLKEGEQCKIRIISVIEQCLGGVSMWTYKMVTDESESTLFLKQEEKRSDREGRD